MKQDLGFPPEINFNISQPFEPLMTLKSPLQALK